MLLCAIDEIVKFMGGSNILFRRQKYTDKIEGSSIKLL